MDDVERDLCGLSISPPLCKIRLARVGCSGPHWFRGHGDSITSLSNLFQCSGNKTLNLADTWSHSHLGINAVLFDTQFSGSLVIVSACRHKTTLSCRKPLHYKYQESTDISDVQRNTALIQADFYSFILYKELHLCYCIHKLSALSWHRQVPFLAPGQFLLGQNCCIPREKQEYISLAGTGFIKTTVMGSTPNPHWGK